MIRTGSPSARCSSCSWEGTTVAQAFRFWAIAAYLALTVVSLFVMAFATHNVFELVPTPIFIAAAVYLPVMSSIARRLPHRCRRCGVTLASQVGPDEAGGGAGRSG